MTSTEAGLGIEAKSDAIYELLEEGSKVERLATGFTFTEGPIWHPDGAHLLFSDMPGDVAKVHAGREVDEVMRPARSSATDDVGRGLDLSSASTSRAALARALRQEPRGASRTTGRGST